MVSENVAVVTGANRGIGYEIVKGLCKKYDGHVYLTARDVVRGNAAIEKLKILGLNPIFHQLDISDQKSVDTFKDHIKEKHGGINILINNAGVSLSKAPIPLSEKAKKTLELNYFGTVRICEALFPLLRENARVVNVSSLAGQLNLIPSEKLRNRLKDPNLTITELNNIMEKFIRDADQNRHIEEGWGESIYVVSKVGVSALTIIQQRNFDKELPNRNISVNSVHPGYVQTDMTGFKGELTAEQGAEAPLFLALEANLKGKYVWFDCGVVDWDGPPIGKS
ncbi:carbonyl reductase [NADPH] 3-like [Cylas formicarius]|uniref:carbonyl reductase [NADPH] 3-like n=1 Tax=Cylas formicarius TaxID=197179 RepID=UPI0029588854|nr:carbonyl reductase [NADPH] 3-like [Cylas formicarius]